MTREQLVQVVRLLTVQETFDEFDLAPLLIEVVFLAQFEYGWENGTAQDMLFNSTALHLAVYFDLETVARVLLAQSSASLSFA